MSRVGSTRSLHDHHVLVNRASTVTQSPFSLLTQNFPESPVRREPGPARTIRSFPAMLSLDSDRHLIELSVRRNTGQGRSSEQPRSANFAMDNAIWGPDWCRRSTQEVDFPPIFCWLAGVGILPESFGDLTRRAHHTCSTTQLASSGPVWAADAREEKVKQTLAVRGPVHQSTATP